MEMRTKVAINKSVAKIVKLVGPSVNPGYNFLSTRNLAHVICVHALYLVRFFHTHSLSLSSISSFIEANEENLFIVTHQCKIVRLQNVRGHLVFGCLASSYQIDFFFRWHECTIDGAVKMNAKIEVKMC